VKNILNLYIDGISLICSWVNRVYFSKKYYAFRMMIILARHSLINIIARAFWWHKHILLLGKVEPDPKSILPFQYPARLKHKLIISIFPGFLLLNTWNQGLNITRLEKRARRFSKSDLAKKGILIKDLVLVVCCYWEKRGSLCWRRVSYVVKSYGHCVGYCCSWKIYCDLTLGCKTGKNFEGNTILLLAVESVSWIDVIRRLGEQIYILLRK